MNPRPMRVIALLGWVAVLLGAVFLLIGLDSPGGETRRTALVVLGASLLGFAAVALLAWLAVDAIRQYLPRLDSDAADDAEAP